MTVLLTIFPQGPVAEHVDRALLDQHAPEAPSRALLLFQRQPELLLRDELLHHQDLAEAPVAMISARPSTQSVSQGDSARAVAGVAGAVAGTAAGAVDDDAERLERQSATGDLRAARDRMFGADSSLPDEQVKDPA